MDDIPLQLMPVGSPDRIVGNNDGLTDLFDTGALANGVYESLAELRERVMSDDPAQAALARGSLGLARRYAMPPSFRYPRQVPPPSRTHSWVEAVYKFGGKVEIDLENVAYSLRRERMRNSRLAHYWTPARILLSFGVAVLVVSGLFDWAFVVLAVRMAGSLRTGASWTFPAERRSADREERTWACWTGHLCDAIVLLAIVGGAVGAGRASAAMILMGGLVAQLLATLARVAALQHGLRLNRLRLERVVRAGGTLVAVGIAASVAAVHSYTPWALLAILAAVPAFIYATIEGARVVAATYLEWDQPVSILVGSTEVFATPTPSECMKIHSPGVSAA